MPGVTRGPAPNFGVDVSALSRGSSGSGGSGSGGGGGGGGGAGCGNGGGSGEGFAVGEEEEEEEEERAPSSSPPIFGEHSIDAATSEAFSGHAAGDDFMVRYDPKGSSPEGSGGGGGGGEGGGAGGDRGNGYPNDGAFSSPPAAAAGAVSPTPAKLGGDRTVSPSKVPLTPSSLFRSSSDSPEGAPPAPSQPLPPRRQRRRREATSAFAASSSSSVKDIYDSSRGGGGGRGCGGGIGIDGHGAGGGGDAGRRMKEEGERRGRHVSDASGEWDDDTSLPPEMEPLSRATEVSPVAQRRPGEGGEVGAGAAGGAGAGHGGGGGGAGLGHQNGQMLVAAGSKTPPGGPKKLGGKDEYAFVAAGNE